MASSQHVRIELAPKAGFCVKSSALTPGVLPAPPVPKTSPNLLEPNAPITVPKGLKVFVNIAWDSKVPPPPEGSEEEILRAMQGEEVGETNPSGWYVPVIVSNGREDKDKAGNPSIVFDCIYNTSVKSRTLRDPEFKVFLVAGPAAHRAQTGLSLSRNIGTPNIVSKGKLLPRTVQIPVSLLHLSGRGGAATSSSVPARSSRAQLEVPADPRDPAFWPFEYAFFCARCTVKFQRARCYCCTKQAKGRRLPPRSQRDSEEYWRCDLQRDPRENLLHSLYLLSGANIHSKIKFRSKPTCVISSIRVDDDADDGGAAAPLDWSWTKDDTDRLRIETHALVESSTLDVEPRRFTLLISPTPSFPRRTVDVDLSLSDADILSRLPSSQSKTSRVLELKRERDFDVDGARAEWVVGSGVVKIWV
ncbi:hypothetical protein NLJ89_g9834 [Agrocybe chaxingu]|uniref:PIH1 N-terminal domain-containing protein n=1 Tax=Agrocybe chaxingu TaxID=84603 RepID=A0A9W8MRG6_9AGAR|nr:hypothetical protein NLJ89_g9834 [Agrocybe chaxingu]